MRSIMYYFVVLMSVFCLSGCGTKQEHSKENIGDVAVENIPEQEVDTTTKEADKESELVSIAPTKDDEIAMREDVPEDIIDDIAEEEEKAGLDMNIVSDFSFADVSDLEFYFSSGVGGWWTEMYIHEDGSFEGTFRDGNMGITGENYPNGQMYYSSFNGKFTEPEMIDEYTYQCGLEFMEYDRCEGSEIIDGVRIDYTMAYGVAGGTTFYFYLPGKAWQELPDDFRSWVGGEFIWRYEGDVYAEDVLLPFYGLFNLEEGCGFTSYEIEQ